MSRAINADRGSSAQRIGERQLVNPLDENWNRTLACERNPTIFHTSEWARVLIETYGYKPYYFAWQAAGHPLRLCLFEIDSWLTGRRAVCLPFADECQVLGAETSAQVSDSLSSIAELGRKRKWESIEVRGVPPDFVGNAYASYFGHELTLSAGTEELFRNCSDSARRAVRKAERAGVLVEIRKDFAAIEDYFELHCLTRKKHGVPPQPFKFFGNIHQQLIAGGLGFTALARLNGRVLAGAVFLVFQKQALYKFGASDPRMDIYRPSNLVMWRGIQHLAEQGASTLSFGRTDLQQDGLRRYKLGWGAKEKAIFYLKFHVQSETFVTSKSSVRLNRIFSVMPSHLLKRIGSLLYRHLG